MQHDIGARVAEKPSRVGLVGQVVVALPGNNDLGNPSTVQPRNNRPPKEPRATCHHDTGANKG